MVEPLADKPPERTLDEWLREVARDTVLVPVISEEWITIDGLRALRVRNGGAETRNDNVYFVHQGKTFAILSPDEGSKSYPLYERMLVSFRFAGR